MEVSVPLYASITGFGAKRMHEYFADYYSGKKMVEVMPLGDSSAFNSKLLPSNAMTGKNTMKIYVGGNEERVLIVSNFDNLGKGASGAAVQCMNVMFGLDESLGLL